jgi:hypothetical protein
VIQGATVQEIGFGPFTVSFGKPNSGNASGNNNGSQPSGNGSGNNAGNGTGNGAGNGTGGSGNGSGDGSGTGSNPVSGDATISGNWSGTRGSVVVAVTQVDVQQGHLRLHIKVTNNGSDAIDLPLFGYCNATDDKDTTYNADPQASSMPEFNAPANGFVTGIIELSPTVTAGATTLKLNFTQIFGFGSPGGGVSVSGIPIPH